MDKPKKKYYKLPDMWLEHARETGLDKLEEESPAKYRSLRNAFYAGAMEACEKLVIYSADHEEDPDKGFWGLVGSMAMIIKEGREEIEKHYKALFENGG